MFAGTIGMDKKHPKKSKRVAHAPGPGHTLRKDTEASDNSLFHIAIVIVFGILLCLFMGALDHVSKETTPISDTMETIG